MSDSTQPTQPCERCGEWGCEPALHPEKGSELAMVATMGALLGGTLLGLVALPAWLRRFEQPDAPPGDPRWRLAQDRRVTGVVSALAMATITLGALTVAAVETFERGPSTVLHETVGDAPRGTEMEEILHLIEEGSPTEAAVGMEQLAELAPDIEGDVVGQVAETYGRVMELLGWADERSRSLRTVLLRSDEPEAAIGLAASYDDIDDADTRLEVLRALGHCADPESLGAVIASETERYRTPELAQQIDQGCVPEVAHALLALADAHVPERPGVYRGLAEACDALPRRTQAKAGAAIGERWLALGSRPPAEQAAPAVDWLAHAVACADEALLDQALATIPEHADEWARAEVQIVAYRRGRLKTEALLDLAETDRALRRRLQDMYEGTAPWEDPVAVQLSQRSQQQAIRTGTFGQEARARAERRTAERARREALRDRMRRE